MYLDRKTKCAPTALFDVPHKPVPVTSVWIAKKFPEFAKEMNGSSEDCCLTYFWKRNKETKVYEFIDEEAEEEIAEIWGVEIYDEDREKGREAAKSKMASRALTEDEIRDFKEELAFVSNAIQQFNNGIPQTDE